MMKANTELTEKQDENNMEISIKLMFRISNFGTATCTNCLDSLYHIPWIIRLAESEFYLVLKVSKGKSEKEIVAPFFIEIENRYEIVIIAL